MPDRSGHRPACDRAVPETRPRHEPRIASSARTSRNRVPVVASDQATIWASSPIGQAAEREGRAGPGSPDGRSPRVPFCSLDPGEQDRPPAASVERSWPGGPPGTGARGCPALLRLRSPSLPRPHVVELEGNRDRYGDPEGGEDAAPIRSGRRPARPGDRVTRTAGRCAGAGSGSGAAREDRRRKGRSAEPSGGRGLRRSLERLPDDALAGPGPSHTGGGHRGKPPPSRGSRSPGTAALPQAGRGGSRSGSRKGTGYWVGSPG